MKILLVHNFYGSAAPSGENTVFLAETELLRRKGHKIVKYVRYSDDILKHGMFGKFQGALSTPWNPFSAWKLKKILNDERPDVMHVHNFFPLLSPAIFHAVDSFNTATVMTLHNYRLFCAAGFPLRNGSPCMLCLENKNVSPAIHYGCYRGSRIATVPMATMIELHRLLQTWNQHIDAFISVSIFQKELMVKAGLPDELIRVKPHFCQDGFAPLPWDDRENKIIFIGRLGEEKGVETLVKAWGIWGAEAPLLEIIGDGPLRKNLSKLVEKTGLEKKIILKGQLSFEATQKSLLRSRLLIVPSIWFEIFGMVICEAFAHGVPVVASRIGPLPDIVEEGVVGALFEPNNAQDLLRVVRTMWSDQDRLAQLATEARKIFEEKYTADVNHQMLMDIYASAIERRKQKLS